MVALIDVIVVGASLWVKRKCTFGVRALLAARRTVGNGTADSHDVVVTMKKLAWFLEGFLV